VNRAAVATVAALAAGAWALLLASAFTGDGLTFTHGRLCGASLAGAGALGGFLAAWMVMIAAMMLPDVAATLAPRRDKVGGAALGGYVAGYLALWAVVGVTLFVAGDALRLFSDAGAPFAAGDFAGAAAVLGLLGCGQFASAAFVQRLRAPVLASPSAVAPIGWRAGLALGCESVRCCWAVMLFMLAAKLHDPLSVAAFTVLVAYQRHGRWGCSAARALGVAALADALFAVAMRTSPL
jgi:predicted metal-binding membrane protein